MTTDLVLAPRQLPVPTGVQTLHRAVAVYLLNKRKRLTPKSQLGYERYLRTLITDFSDYTLDRFEPPIGSSLLEDFLNAHWGERAPATYNKAHSVLSDFFAWHVKRMNLMRDPMQVIEKAKKRPYHRTTFSESQCVAILMANPDPRAQVALRLLLFYGIRKGALQNIRFEHFNRDRNELTIFTKGETIQKIQFAANESIWAMLDEINAPGSHYLLPSQKRRRRTPLYRKELIRLKEVFAEAQRLVDVVSNDAQSVREAGELQAYLDLSYGWLERVIDSATSQTRLVHDASIGDHAMHCLWYRWLARAGVVAKGITHGERLHKARHTAAQRVLDATGNIKAAQKLLGHKSSATTEVYTEYSDDQLGTTMLSVLGNIESDLHKRAQGAAGNG